MSIKATKPSRMAAKALANKDMLERQDQLAAEAESLAKKAADMAISAICLAKRANASQNSLKENLKRMEEIASDVRKTAKAAHDHFYQAWVGERYNDPVATVVSAKMAMEAAVLANTLASEATMINSSRHKMTPDYVPPAPTMPKPRSCSHLELKVDELAAAIDRSARYFVTYDSVIIATFSNEDDAFLLESELADQDSARGVKNSKCEVFDRATRRRLGGYFITSGNMVLFLRNKSIESRRPRGKR